MFTTDQNERATVIFPLLSRGAVNAGYPQHHQTLIPTLVVPCFGSLTYGEIFQRFTKILSCKMFRSKLVAHLELKLRRVLPRKLPSGQTKEM